MILAERSSTIVFCVGGRAVASVLRPETKHQTQESAEEGSAKTEEAS
jgi:hypothetical protein